MSEQTNVTYSDLDAHELDGAEQLEIDGRAPRVAVLVFNEVTNDSRVLKETATLRGAGAEALIIGFSSKYGTTPAGDAVVDGELPVHRTKDLDLVALLPRTTRAWRRFRGRDAETGRRVVARATPTTAAVPADDVAVTAGPGGTGTSSGGASGTGVLASLLRRGRDLAYDVGDRTYKVARLCTYWGASVKVARRFGADVVHANDGNTLAAAMVIRLLTGARIVYDSHELWRRRNVRRRPVAPIVEAIIESVGIRAADAVVTVSPSIARWLQARYSLATTPLLVRNVPLATGGPAAPSQGRLREMAGLGAGDRIVSYTGGITTGRGLEETVDALALLPENVHLVLLGFGNPEYLARFDAYVHEAGVAHRVHLVGKVPSAQVAKTLADADLAIVYVRPIVLSYRFALPNKIFESIHAGLPIVAADLPDMAEMVETHEIGVTFGEGSPAELAAAISAVLADPDRYRRNVRSLASTLDWREEAGRLLTAYRLALLNRATSRRRR